MKSLSLFSGVIVITLSLMGCVNGNEQKQQVVAGDSVSVLKDSVKHDTVVVAKTDPYNFDKHADIKEFWNDFKKAALNKDKENMQKMCVKPLPNYYYDNGDVMKVERLFEKELVDQLNKIDLPKKTTITKESFEITQFKLKTNVPVYIIDIEGWEYSGAILYFTLIDGKFMLAGVQSFESEG